MDGRLAILRADTQRLPLPDGYIDTLIVSPPYWGVREYEDQGEAIAGQLGAERDWRDYLDHLLAWTAEWVRVLSPRGSMFVNLSDKYSDRGHGPSQGEGTGRGPQGGAALSQSRGVMEKSLLNLPHRYAIRCTDELGLIQRGCVVWGKANAIPSSAKDRVRADHEYVFHFTKQPEYYHATDMIREPLLHPGKTRTSGKARQAWAHDPGKQAQNGLDAGDENPLGRIPGSVWIMASYPLHPPRYYWRHATAVEWVKDDPAAWRWLAANPTGDRSLLPRSDEGRLELRAAPNHYAAFPPALVRRCVLGWSPREVCLACGEGRFPVTAWTGEEGRTPGGQDRYGRSLYSHLSTGRLRGRQVTGWACACTPSTMLPRSPSARPAAQVRSAALGRGWRDNPGGGYGNYPPAPAQQQYHFEEWEPPPTRPGRVLDPCSGTFTVPLVAAAFGRDGIGTDLSADYCLLGQWRTNDPGEQAAALDVPRPKQEAHDQGELFGRAEAVPGGLLARRAGPAPRR